MATTLKRAIGIVAVIVVLFLAITAFSGILILAQDDTEGGIPGVPPRKRVCRRLCRRCRHPDAGFDAAERPGWRDSQRDYPGDSVSGKATV